jgi:hypothetical protein
LIPTPIRHVLSTIQKHQVQALLMGGQACVFYGAAQFSKDIDLLLLANDANYAGLHRALEELKAVRIAIPRFDPAVLERGHAVHYRCKVPEVEGLRVDIMTQLRDLPVFSELWARRTSVILDEGLTVEALAIPDLVQAKKTQRGKDWPVIAALVENHYQALHNEPLPERIEFWLTETREEERLIELVTRFPAETENLLSIRPLLGLAREKDLPALRAALDAEMRAEQEKDRIYWEPLKREMEAFRRAEREQASG